jgi:hypothetical protein
MATSLSFSAFFWSSPHSPDLQGPLYSSPLSLSGAMQSMAREKRIGDRMHPCFTSVLAWKGSVTFLLWMTQHSKFLYRSWISLKFHGKKRFSKVNFSAHYQLLAQKQQTSKMGCSIHGTFPKSLIAWKCGQCFPFLKPACSCFRVVSAAALIHYSMMWQRWKREQGDVPPVRAVFNISFLWQFDDGPSFPCVWTCLPLPDVL